MLIELLQRAAAKILEAAFLASEKRITEAMSHKIKEFSDSVNAKLDTLGTALDGIAGDTTKLKADLEALKNSLDEPSPESQALLDAIDARVQSIANRATGMDAETT